MPQPVAAMLPTCFGQLQTLSPEELEGADPALEMAHQRLLEGQAEPALAAAAAVLRLNPQSPAALVLSTDGFKACGKPVEALELLRRAAALRPQSAAFQLLTGQHLLDLGQAEEAQLWLERGLALLGPASNAGTQQAPTQLHLLLTERLAQALILCNQLEQAWSLLAPLASDHLSLAGLAADLLLRLNRASEALPLAEAHVRYAGTAEAYLLQAGCQFRSGDQAAYAALLRQGAARFPQNGKLTSLAAQASFDEADSNTAVQASWELLNSGLQQAGPLPEIRFLEARQLLLDGCFEQGWPAYEARLRLPNNQLVAPCPEAWSGQNPAGQSVVVVAEQGVGDVLFFARFLPALLAEAGTVFLVVEPRLVALLRRSYPQVVVLEQPELARALAGTEALWIPLASLPLRYGTTPEAIAATAGVQLRLQASLQHLWAQHVQRDADEPVRLGLSLTAGGSAQEYQQRKRDVEAALVLEPLQALDVTLIDLQHREALSHDSNSSLQVLRFEGITRDLDQLCALISQLDGLITSDQTNAFLGGMLGIPTLALVPPNPHFMFGRRGPRSVWFDRLHIVRAPRWADWHSAKTAYGMALKELLSGM